MMTIACGATEIIFTGQVSGDDKGQSDFLQSLGADDLSLCHFLKSHLWLLRVCPEINY
jgi:hypothetical protein